MSPSTSGSACKLRFHEVQSESCYALRDGKQRHKLYGDLFTILLDSGDVFDVNRPSVNENRVYSKTYVQFPYRMTNNV